MTVGVKNDSRSPLVVPRAIRRQARFRSGQELEFKASTGVIVIVPKLPSANHEYTSAQRRTIDAQLADASKGPFHGPFETAEDMAGDMRRKLRNRSAAKKAKLGRTVKSSEGRVQRRRT